MTNFPWNMDLPPLMRQYYLICIISATEMRLVAACRTVNIWRAYNALFCRTGACYPARSACPSGGGVARLACRIVRW